MQELKAWKSAFLGVLAPGFWLGGLGIEVLVWDAWEREQEPPCLVMARRHVDFSRGPEDRCEDFASISWKPPTWGLQAVRLSTGHLPEIPALPDFLNINSSFFGLVQSTFHWFCKSLSLYIKSLPVEHPRAVFTFLSKFSLDAAWLVPEVKSSRVFLDFDCSDTAWLSLSLSSCPAWFYSWKMPDGMGVLPRCTLSSLKKKWKC